MLSFIHYARWVIVKEFPPGGEKLHYPYLLFESNFNGSWDQYIDAFSEVVPARMKGIWGTSYGFPGPIPVEPFKDYIRANEYVANHYWNAYPGATTTEIISAARVSAAVDELSARAALARPGRVQGRLRGHADRDPARPVSRNVSGQAYALTVLTPILDGHAAELTAHLDALPEGDASPLARVPGHAPRALGGDRPGQVPGPRAAPARLARRAARLLFTSNFDGELDPYLERLQTGLGEDADAIWGHCRGYPGRGAGGFARWLQGAPARGGAVLRRLRRPHASSRCTRTSTSARG